MRMLLLVLVLLLLLLHNGCQLQAARQNRLQQLLASAGVRAQRYDPRLSKNGGQQYTEIDRDLRQLFLLTRSSTLDWALHNLKALSMRSRHEGKMQAPIARQLPFPCDLKHARSAEPPISVERLRPGDIDVIAAFGDSLSAGNGILSNTALDMINEFRGLTFSGGGMGTWRQYLTLPNILKVFNPQLYGFAVNNSLVVDQRAARLNIAEPLVMSHDLPFQARVLIDRLRRDPHVDIQRHWKLLTIFVGNNDICSDMCLWDDANALLERHARDLRRSLALLRDHVPRLLINLIVVPNLLLTLHTMTNVPLPCFLVHRVGCHCLSNDRLSAAELQLRMHTIQRWQQIDMDMARRPEFQRQDFAVIAHPMIANVTVASLPSGQTDWRLFAHDCFHFSQRGHATLANMLWNSMLLPDELKPRQLHKPFERFVCPSEQHPYFITRPSATS